MNQTVSRGVAAVTVSAIMMGLLPAALAQDTSTTIVNPPPGGAVVVPGAPPEDSGVSTRPLSPVAPGHNYVATETAYESKPLYGLMATGGTVFAVSYLATVISAAAINPDSCRLIENDLGCRSANWPIYVPLVGPFIQMGYLEGENRNVGRALLAVDGVVQGAGLTMFLIGAIARKRVPAVNRTVQISTFTPAGGGGLMAFGRF